MTGRLMTPHRRMARAHYLVSHMPSAWAAETVERWLISRKACIIPNPALATSAWGCSHAGIRQPQERTHACQPARCQVLTSCHCACRHRRHRRRPCRRLCRSREAVRGPCHRLRLRHRLRHRHVVHPCPFWRTPPSTPEGLQQCKT